MSKTTISASATGLPSRRTLLAAGSAAAVFGALHEAIAAEAQQDPDAELIALCQAAIAADKQVELCGVRCDSVVARREGRQVTLADRIALSDADKAYYEAMDKAIACKPHTMRGVRALIELVQNDFCFDPDRMQALMAMLLASPALAI